VRAYSIVIATVGRPSLGVLLEALAAGTGPLPQEVIIVNDRPERPLALDVIPILQPRLRIVSGPGRGAAAARNAGWRLAAAPWIVFLDDDVIPGPQWMEELQADLATSAAAVQGDISVPLPTDRRPTDWERQVAGLARAPWISADIAYRREVLTEVGGFDERFRRPRREDTDLAIRVNARGHLLTRGTRQATHPIEPVGPWISLTGQSGSADDALLRRLYGPRWRTLAQAPPGIRSRHLAVTAAGLASLAAAATGRPKVAATSALVWLAGTVQFAARRIRPGPKTASELATMVATSVLIPPVATAHWLRGWFAHRNARPLGQPSP
jgi:glycosyltransferase involved in cell wall biosynthesis